MPFGFAIEVLANRIIRVRLRQDAPVSVTEVL